ncbi:hypothetical protein P5704_023785 (plasmid) [Pseudomonas sp. FeN3W]|nr:hypothetical protein P5704_023785 [Pseudomonas sp. FeN3W]
MNLAPLVILCTFLYLAPITAQASINNTVVAQGNWEYSWETRSSYPLSISLDIDEKTRKKAYLSDGDLLDYKRISVLILDQMRVMARNLTTPGIRISVQGTSLSNFEATAWAQESLQGEAQKSIEAIYTFAKDAIKPIEKSTYYRYNRETRSLGINYNKIAKDYEALVIQTLLALSKTLKTEDRIILRDSLLDMLQSIPYTDLAMDDFPLLNPARMLLEKRGDCESKQVFMAAALKLLFPERRVLLLQLPEQEHIVLSYAGDHGEEILMDATGPARLPVGKLGPHTTLNQKVISYEINF